MWTLEPLVRRPEFAPVVLWIDGAGNVPVVPLEFHANWYPILCLGDQRRGFSEFGFVDYGTFEITAGLASIMQLRGHLVGRTRHFGNEGSVTFTLPRSILPRIATTRRTDPADADGVLA